MKIFLTAVSVLALTVAFVIVNSVLVERLSVELMEEAKTLDFGESSEGEIKSLMDKWEKYRGFFSVSSQYIEIERVNSAAGDMLSYFQSRSAEHFAAARERFVRALEKIHKSEMFHFDNVI